MERRAFTAVEVLLTLGIVAVTAGISVPMYRNYQIRNDLDLATEQTIQALRSAQLLSQTGKNDAQWGVYVPEGVLFQGEAYVLRDPDQDESYPLPSTIDVSGIREVVYSRIDGMPSETGEIILMALSGERRIITISADGILTVTGILPLEIFDEQGMPGDGDEDGGSDGDSDGTQDPSGEDGDGTSDDDGTGDTDGDGTQDPSDDTGSTGGEPCEDRFRVASDGTIETTGSVDVTVKALGSAITYGVDGPKVRVYAEISTDGGQTWTPLFNGQEIDGGEQQVIENLPSDAQIVVRINGRYGWLFNRTYQSNDRSGHIEVLRNGDVPPAYVPYGSQESLETFLQQILDADGKISIGEYDAVLLAELGTLDTVSSDFQDAVLLIQFAQKPNSCATANEPRFKVVFERLENTGHGNVQRAVYAGEAAVRFAESQWIPLQINGVPVVDGGLIENAPGLAVERRPGAVRVLQYGTLPVGSKEIVDARIIFANALVTEVANDEGSNATEEPFDSVVNDGPGGDEVTQWAAEVLFQTRVTISNDAIIIHWQEGATETGDGDGDGTQDPSGDDGDGTSDDDGTGETDGDGTQDSPDGEEGDGTSTDGTTDVTETDPCAAQYTIENGRIVLQEVADVTVRALGSHATYGLGGPKIQVRLMASLDGGNTWRSLYGYRSVDGGEFETFSSVAAGSEILLKAEGRYGWLFRQQAHSGDNSARVRLLRPGDAVPATTPFQNTVKLESFLRSVIRSGVANVNTRKVLALVELQSLDSASDFQDAVVEISVERPFCGDFTDDGITDTGDTSDDETGDTVDDDTEKMIICHYPSGDLHNPVTIEISQSAWSAHQRRGARPGACEDDGDGDGVPNSHDLCPDTYMPESIPHNTLLFNRYALTSNSDIFREGPRKKIGAYTLADTKGCSCEQLLEVAEGTKPYYFDQFPKLHRNMRSLFPFFTLGARNFGCSKAILNMVKNAEL